MGIWRQALTGEYQPHGLESDADVILAFAFGRGNGVPGAVNEALAEMAVKKSLEHQIGIVAQMAVADAIEANFPHQNVPLSRIDPRNPREAYYMHSDDVHEQAANFIEPHEVVMVLAQANHAPRADRRTATRYETVLPEGLPTDWDPNSIFQEMQCRSPLIWGVRETFVLAGYKLTGRFKPARRSDAPVSHS